MSNVDLSVGRDLQVCCYASPAVTASSLCSDPGGHALTEQQRGQALPRRVPSCHGVNLDNARGPVKTLFVNTGISCLPIRHFATLGGMTATPRSANLNDNITTVTRLLMALRGGVNQSELADGIGLHKALVTRSFAGKRPWKIDDVEHLAAFFDVSPTLFFEQPEELFRSRCDWSATEVAITEREPVAA